MTDLLLQFHEYQSTQFASLGGEHWFLVETLLVAAAICRWGIPLTTDMMVNASAGLAGKYLGEKYRTLVINASTNNPELFNMLISLFMRRAGGVANPLGSNFANIYLMYLVAPIWLILYWAFTGKFGHIKDLLAVIARERVLVASHIFMAFLMFVFATTAYWCLTGIRPIGADKDAVAVLQPWTMIAAAAGVCLVGIMLFRIWDANLQKKRPELFDDIHSANHKACWRTFFIGTGGLVISSVALNAIFLAWSEVYSAALTGVFGAAVFAGLHYFVGALVTSLPELKVAIDNYERRSSADLNTALASASVSNMANLAVAIIGVLVIGLMSLLGATFTI